MDTNKKGNEMNSKCENCGKETRGGKRLIHTEHKTLHTCKACYNLLNKKSNHGDHNEKIREEKIAEMKAYFAEME